MNWDIVWPIALSAATLALGWFKENIFNLLNYKRDSKAKDLDYIGRQQELIDSALNTIERLEQKRRELDEETYKKIEEMESRIAQLSKAEKDLSDLKSLYEKALETKKAMDKVIEEVRVACECGKAVLVIEKHQITWSSNTGKRS